MFNPNERTRTVSGYEQMDVIIDGIVTQRRIASRYYRDRNSIGVDVPEMLDGETLTEVIYGPPIIIRLRS